MIAKENDEQIPFALKWSILKHWSVCLFIIKTWLGIDPDRSNSRHFGEKDLAILQTICTQLGVLLVTFYLINIINEKHQTLMATINSMYEGLVFLEEKER